RKHNEMERGRQHLKATRIPGAAAEGGSETDRRWAFAYDILGQPGGAERLLEHGARPMISEPAWRALCAEACYAPFAERQQREAQKLTAGRQISLPEPEAFSDLPGLSSELRQKLLAARPTTLADAERIEGMTPAALALLLVRSRSDAA